jgi:hypothetical protein
MAGHSAGEERRKGVASRRQVESGPRESAAPSKPSTLRAARDLWAGLVGKMLAQWEMCSAACYLIPEP